MKSQKIKLDRRKLRKLTRSKNPFGSLVRSIVYQQLSTKSATAIFTKLLALFPKEQLIPETLLSLSNAELRSAGVSPQKVSYLRDLATKFGDGTIDSKKLSRMKDEELKNHLIQVKGIGPWTVDMFMISALNRPDILPLGDLGIKKGFQKVFKLKKLPSEATMLSLAEPYVGERTYLSLYLWQSLEK